MIKFLCLVLLANALLTSSAYSAEWTLTSKLDPSVEYDDNVLMAKEKQGSFQYSIKPTMTAKRKTENNEVSLSGGYDIDRYTSFARLNKQNPFVLFKSRLGTERSNYGLSASFTKRSSRSTAEDDDGDFSTESTVSTKTVSPSYSYQLTERDSLSLGGNYSKKTFSTADFNGNTSKSVNTGWQHQFSERFSAGPSFSVTNFQSDGLFGPTEYDNYNLNVNTSYNLSERWSLKGGVGIRRLNSSDSLGVSESSTGSSFDFKVWRRSEVGSISTGFERSLSPSNKGQVNEQDRLTMGGFIRLNEFVTALFSARYIESTLATDNGGSKRETFSFSPSVKWRIEKALALKFAYNYRQQKSSSVDSTVKSNAVMMTLIYNWDGIRLSR